MERSGEVVELNQEGTELILTRLFDAPLERVWQAWTECDQLMRWWGPKDFTAPACRIDLRAGGAYLFCMRSPAGQDYWSTGTYHEIAPLERLAASDSFADENGSVVPASHYGIEDEFPLELQMAVTFEDQDGKTRMTLRHAGFPPGPTVEMTAAGWNESFDKLAEAVGR
jgi:uncharacterized protein YndB with AHSA1/START domain